jgi:hypothetical protein
VRKEFPSVRIIESRKNLGFAKGNNIGIKEARGELIATLNNDTEVTPRWLEELVSAMASNEKVGMCASKMLFMKDHGMINSTGICLSRSGTCWDRGIFEPDTGQYGSMEEVFGPCAGAALYRKSMLEEIGLFDEDFHAYVEDTDLAFRGRLAGWKCLYVPNAVVYHVHAGTSCTLLPIIFVLIFIYLCVLYCFTALGLRSQTPSDAPPLAGFNMKSPVAYITTLHTCKE